MMKQLSKKNNGKGILILLMLFAFGMCVSYFLLDFRWVEIQVHSAIESLGSAIALCFICFLWVEKSNRTISEELKWILIGIFYMSVLDLAHACVDVGKLFVWLHSLSVFLGGLFFFFALVMPRWFKLSSYCVVFIILLAMPILLLSFLYQQFIPVMVTSLGFAFAAKFLNLFGGLGFLIATFCFFYKGHKSQNLDYHVFALHSVLFAWAGLLFELSVLWDPSWWYWHFLRLSAYLMLLTFILGRSRMTLLEVEEEKQLAMEELKWLYRKHKLAINSSNIGIWEWNVSTNELEWNDAMFELYGVDKSSKPTYDVWRNSVSSEYLDLAEANLHQALNARTKYDICFEIVLDDGTKKFIKATGQLFEDQVKGDVFVGINIDLTDMVQVSALLSSSSIGIMTLNLASQQIELKHSASQLIFLSDETSIIHESAWIKLLSDKSEVVYQEAKNKLLNLKSGSIEYELELSRSNDDVIWVHVQTFYNFSVGSKENTLISVFYDMTDKKNHEKKLVEVARYDDLTALPNRKYFFEELERAILKAKRYGRRFAVLFIDVDDFKKVNDTYGHAGGDEYLKHIANQLKAASRETDFPARFGGDEFVVVLEGVREDIDVLELVEKIQLSLVSSKIRLASENVDVTISIGVSIFPDSGLTSEELLKNADAAMYQAKKNGKNACSLYQKTDK